MIYYDSWAWLLASVVVQIKPGLLANCLIKVLRPIGSITLLNALWICVY